MTEITPKPILLSTAYLPPISYMSYFAGPGELWVEKHENFIKQTYRNRCVVLGANGPISLVIPVEKARDTKVRITDTRIYNHEAWQRTHWRTIFSAYNSSPFFEYYQDYLIPFYEKRWEFLFDFNQQLIAVLMEILTISHPIQLTCEYRKIYNVATDARNYFSPQKPAGGLEPYTQVFSEKFSFTPDLSIIDLLFNLGPDSLNYLEKIHAQKTVMPNNIYGRQN